MAHVRDYILLILLLFASPMFGSHRLATFNIRCTQSSDTASRDWGYRGEACAKLIKGYGFDVVGLQELTGDGMAYRNPSTNRSQLKDVCAWLPGYELLMWDRDGSKRKEYVGVAFRKSRYSMMEKGHFFISATPEKYSKGWDPKVRKHPRVVGWVKLHDKKSGEEFIFASTHTNNGWSLDGPYGSEMIAKEMKKIAGNLPLMIVGDFNTTRNEEDRKGIKAYHASFHDAALEVEEECNYSVPTSMPQVNWTYNGFNAPSDTTCRGREIDFMFYDGMKIKGRHIITNEYKYKGKRYPVSDHFPIYVDVDMAPKKKKVIYVNSNAKGGDGSRENPFGNISLATGVADIGDTIKVAAGVYRESIESACSLTIIGGYDSEFNVADGKSIIEGEGLSRSPVYLAGYYSLSLKNFEIRNYVSPQAEYDGAIHFNGTDLYLENVDVVNCKAKRYGGGLCVYNLKYPEYCECNNLTIKDCNFRDNEAVEGGGIAIGVYGILKIEGSEFTGNKATGSGGGIYLTFGEPEKGRIWFTNAQAEISGCRFAGNKAKGNRSLFINDSMPGIKMSITGTEIVD